MMINVSSIILYFILPNNRCLCLIIWFSNKDGFITKILSIKLFVGIGLISYSLFGIINFFFSRITDFTDANILKILFLVGSYLLYQLFPYFFIEKPFRDKKRNFFKILIILIISILALLIFNLTSIFKEGFKKELTFQKL